MICDHMNTGKQGVWEEPAGIGRCVQEQCNRDIQEFARCDRQMEAVWKRRFVFCPLVLVQAQQTCAFSVHARTRQPETPCDIWTPTAPLYKPLLERIQFFESVIVLKLLIPRINPHGSFAAPVGSGSDPCRSQRPHPGGKIQRVRVLSFEIPSKFWSLELSKQAFTSSGVVWNLVLHMIFENAGIRV